VLGLSWSDEVRLILTTEESGVRSIRDLKNRRFGIPKWANVQIDFHPRPGPARAWKTP
jgi:ABC-type nitrate/sulfonate/bicarbonate transport system substrate-binding protein